MKHVESKGESIGQLGFIPAQFQSQFPFDNLLDKRKGGRKFTLVFVMTNKSIFKIQNSTSLSDKLTQPNMFANYIIDILKIFSFRGVTFGAMDVDIQSV